jgi:hypothetical protein|tara:strand:+ start:9365 stop:9601 length:237 start_codon:yes stop_codon:yes gene_type:complete
MSKERKKKSYFVGPFKKAMDNIDTFNINLYYSYYYQDVIQSIIDSENGEVSEEEIEQSYDELLKMISGSQYSEQNRAD